MLEQIIKQLNGTGKVRFKVKIIPKSQNNKVIGLLGDDTLKIKIAAIPEKNKANRELINFLSLVLEVPKNNITIISGEASPIKLIDVQK
ncbi:hypothetical protein COX68_00505 [Candidatus Falkowbacteria bacterium CG_4_10_14_0_2_um_filter_41_15]|uniref:UPF0235 protein COX68_00505 n=1 Tax=Candidatus Falkowbacteria bacterium CG_4_10_14_0_2_um_filter_41_15 TaxID=1974554 RepID=A0A2M7W039_9BACT|nr:MAG: hypothetical protein COX68_00505 [Candidatus Falkowbacteria bacterium CG_4_10_14_0_2_um_filter_41_15]